MSVDEVRKILIAAVDYAIIYNLPLPGDISNHYYLRGRLPDWLQKFLDDETTKHHAYVSFAVREYDTVLKVLRGERKELENLDLPFGKQVLEHMRMRIVSRLGVNGNTQNPTLSSST